MPVASITPRPAPQSSLKSVTQIMADRQRALYEGLQLQQAQGQVAEQERQQQVRSNLSRLSELVQSGAITGQQAAMEAMKYDPSASASMASTISSIGRENRAAGKYDTELQRLKANLAQAKSAAEKEAILAKYAEQQQVEQIQSANTGQARDAAAAHLSGVNADGKLIENAVNSNPYYGLGAQARAKQLDLYANTDLTKAKTTGQGLANSKDIAASAKELVAKIVSGSQKGVSPDALFRFHAPNYPDKAVALAVRQLGLGGSAPAPAMLPPSLPQQGGVVLSPQDQAMENELDGAVAQGDAPMPQVGQVPAPVLLSASLPPVGQPSPMDLARMDVAAGRAASPEMQAVRTADRAYIREQSALVKPIETVQTAITELKNLYSNGYKSGKVDRFINAANPSKWSDNEVFDRSTKALAFGELQKFVGAYANKELDFAKELVVSSKTDEPNALRSLEVLDIVAQRPKQKIAFLESYFKTNGSLDGADSAWGQAVEDNRILSKDENGKLVVNKPPRDFWKPYLNYDALSGSQQAPASAAPDAGAGASVPQEIPDGATATNPSTGQKLIYRDGAWQPLGGGK